MKTWDGRESFRHKVAARAVVFIALRITAQGLELLGWIFLARNLTLGVFGTLSIAFLICRYLGLIGDMGASLRGSRDVVARSHAEVRSLLRWRTVLSLTLTAFFVFGCVAVDKPGLGLVSAAVLSRGLGRDWLALGRQHTWRAVLPQVTQGVAFAALATVCANELQAAATIAVSYMASGALSLAMNRKPEGRGTSHVRPDYWALILTLANQGLMSLDVLIVGWLLSSAKAGIYAASSRLSTAITTAVGLGAVALIADATRAVRDGKAEAVIATARRTAFTLAAFVAVTSPLAYVLIPTLFGSDFEAGRSSAALLILAAAFVVGAHPLLVVHLAKGNDKFIAIQTLFAAVMSAAANVALVPRFGIAGAATTSIVAQAYVFAQFNRRLDLADAGVKHARTKCLDNDTDLEMRLE